MPSSPLFMRFTERLKIGKKHLLKMLVKSAPQNLRNQGEKKGHKGKKT